MNVQKDYERSGLIHSNPAPEVVKLVEALEELVDLMEDTRRGEYIPDSLTTQPARAALVAYRARSNKY